MKNENINDKRAMLLDMQNHPEKYTDEQITALLADDDIKAFAETLAMSKRAVMRQTSEHVDVDDAWQQFAEAHSLPRRNRYKIVAVTTGIIFLSGMALAAVVRWGIFAPTNRNADQPQKPQTERVITTDSLRQDSVAAPKDSVDLSPVTFEDAELGTILTQMGAFYHVNVTFGKETSRHIRLYFQWDKHLDLQQQIDLLNAFERINITLQGNQLNVE